MEKKLTAARHEEKRLRNKLKQITRSERTHRLCIHAGMLEVFLKEPSLFTDEDVMEFLEFIFQIESVQEKLNELIEIRKKEMENEEDKEE